MARIDYERLARQSRGNIREYDRLINSELAESGGGIDTSKAINAWQNVMSSESRNTGGSGNVGSIGKSLFGELATQTGKLIDFSSAGEFPDLIKVRDVINEAKNGGNALGLILKEAFSGLLLQLEQDAELLEEINTKGGMTGELSKAFRKEIWEAYPTLIKLGFSFNDMKESMSKLLTDAGRFKLVSRETIEALAETSRVFFSSLEEGTASIEQFQKVSLGASDTMKVIDDAGKSSLSLGLNARQTTAELVKNIGQLNVFGFEGGIKGLNKMVQSAQELRMNMATTFELAEKVMDPTNALSLAAELQVIGGQLGDFNDPIKMMWMATNNVQGLQDALAGSLESLTSFDAESGRFEIVGANLRRLRAYAKQFGMSFEDASNLAIQASQRTAAATDLLASGLHFERDDDKEFLTNLAQMKGGRMVIEVPESLRDQLSLKEGQTAVALSEMSDKQVAILLEQREELKKKTVEDLTRDQASSVRNISRDVAFLTARARLEMGKQGENILKQLGLDPRKITGDFGEFAIKMENGVVKGSEKLMNTVNQGFEKVKNLKPAEESAKKTAETKKTEEKKITTEEKKVSGKVEIVISSDVSSDMVKRELIRDKNLYNDVKSYLNANIDYA